LPNVYYINSVAASTKGASVIAGTFYKVYSSSTPGQDERRNDSREKAPAKHDKTDPQSGTFGTYAYDLSGNQIWADEFAGWQGIFWVDAASAAPVCAAGGWYSNNPYQGIIRAYNSANGSILLDARTSARVNQVSLSSDGNYLLTAADALCLFKKNGSAFTKVGGAALELNGDSVTTAFISGDGSLAVCATLNRGVFVFTIDDTGLVLKYNWAWPVSGGTCHSVAVNPTGTAFAVGGSNGLYVLFDLATLLNTGNPVLQCTAPQNGVVYSVAVTDAGDGMVAVANVVQGNTKGLVMFNSTNPASKAWTCTTLNSPNRVVLNSAASLVAVADGHPDGCPGTFYLINATTGAPIWNNTTSNMCWGISIAPDGSLVAGGSDNANVYAFSP
jgi:WD40 repeat protein